MTDAPISPPPAAGSRPMENARHERFCHEYMKDLNATQAYIRSGYAPKDADVNGPRLMGSDGVRARVAHLRDEHFRVLHMSANEVLALVAQRARFNIGRITFVTDDGDPYIDLSKASPEDMACIDQLEIEDFVDRRERDADGNVIARDVRRVKIKPGDTLKAQELVMKYHGLLRERVEVDVTDSLASALAQARKRVRDARSK